ncbi:hypothetical protein P3X46_027543 [Hevea brasiliensis]|uniref:WAT1-related protein n=1 Tax=Hevea brasiliensis TaxID=3981 RepID=A0ABQ9L3E7_HEVBR|nr:hypothetical protein P3X46_027543 [Hevea brasiliensis]
MKNQLIHFLLYQCAACAPFSNVKALKAFTSGDLYRRFKPHLLMVLAQIGYTFLYFITEASFEHGMNPHVYITYRHIVAGVVMLPFAYFLERKQRPKLTIALFVEIFILSVLGVGLTLNMYFASLRYTSPTFLASMVNTIASLTIIIAVALRVLSWLYRGPIMENLWHPLIHIHRKTANYHESWLEGSISTVASCISWSIWYIMQAFTLKRYPAQLSPTTWMSFVGAAQSAFFTVIAEHRKSAWTIGFNIDFWSTVYGGVVVSGLIVFIQLWCTEVKGPVFVTIILGAAVVIIGLYLQLWGKEDDQPTQSRSQDQSHSSYEEQKETKIQSSLNSKTTPGDP